MKQEFGERGGDTGRVSCWMVYGGGLDGAGLLNSTAWGQCGAVLARVLPIFMLSAIASSPSFSRKWFLKQEFG